MNRTKNTLFMGMSLDGKISTGRFNKRDFDKDLKKIDGIKEGFGQYYELEKKTDLVSFNSGLVMNKIGVNSDNSPINIPQVSFVIVDNNHLKLKGVKNLIKGLKRLYLVTSNKNHPAFKISSELEIIYYPHKIDFNDLFRKLNTKHNIKNITIQSGGTLNSILFREGLIDLIKIVVIPCIIGGEDTPTLVDGKSLISELDLKSIRTLRLKKISRLKNNYLELNYKVINL